MNEILPIAGKIERLEQQLKEAIHSIWQATLSPEDRSKMQTLASRILSESSDIVQTAQMLAKLGK